MVSLNVESEQTLKEGTNLDHMKMPVFEVGDIVVSKYHAHLEMIVEQVRPSEEGSFFVYLTSLVLDPDIFDIFYEKELMRNKQTLEPDLELGDYCTVTGYPGTYRIYQHLGYKGIYQDHLFLLAKRNKNKKLEFIQALESDILVKEMRTKAEFIQALNVRLDDYLDLYNQFKDKEYLRRVKRLQDFIKTAKDGGK